VKGKLIISKTKRGRYEFMVHIRYPIVITSFFTYATKQAARRAAIREAKRLGIDAA